MDSGLRIQLQYLTFYSGCYWNLFYRLVFVTVQLNDVFATGG